MRSLHPAGIAALLLLCSASAGCTAARREAPAVSANPPSISPASAAEADRAALERARADSARNPYTAADIRFMSGMIGHHAQAIEMSRLAPTNGAAQSVRTLAERIINAQQDEITIMQQWLRDRRQPVPDPGAPAAAMDHAHAAHGMAMAAAMPGMLSAAQLRELDAARGPEFDRLFLTDMIQHHRGAVAMVHVLFGSRGAGQDQSVFKFASDVEADQGSEIARMEQMRSALPP